MRAGWVRLRLGEVTSKIGSGATPRGGEASYKKTGISLIRSLNVHDAGFRAKDLAFICDEQAAALSNVTVEPWDVLLNITGASVARCCVVPNEMLPARVNQHVSILRPMGEQLSPRFLHYLLVSKQYKDRLLDAGDGGATRQALTKAQLQDFSIEFPIALSEQQRIVAILDEAFAGIATAKANAEKNLQNANELFESHLQAVFQQRGEGWVEKRLGEICEIARGGSPRPIKAYMTHDAEGVNWIKISDATASAKYIYSTKEKIKPAGVKRSRMVHDGDFLLSNSMSFGRPYIMRTTGCIHDGWLVLSGYEGSFDQDFLYLLLGSQYVYRQFDRLAAGSTVRNLNIDLASSVVVPMPPVDVQKSIASKLGEISRQIEQLEKTYERKLAALDELKQSLLAKAFAGEL